MSRAIDQFGQLADMVAERGMGFLVEFAPPHTLNCAAKALEIVDALGRDRCRMMLDAMHFFRSGGTVEDMTSLPVSYAQLCDIPKLPPQGMVYMEEAMFNRRIPGEGELPLAEFINALPADCDIGLEVPDIARVQCAQSARQHATRIVAAARNLGVC